MRALGLSRPKDAKKLGPEPSLWEAEMLRDGEKGDLFRDEKNWDDIAVSFSLISPFGYWFGS